METAFVTEETMSEIITTGKWKCSHIRGSWEGKITLLSSLFHLYCLWCFWKEIKHEMIWTGTEL